MYSSGYNLDSLGREELKKTERIHQTLDVF